MALNILKYFLLLYIFNAKISQAHLLHVSRQFHFHGNAGVGVAVRFLVVGFIGQEEKPPRGHLWMEQYLISLK